MVKEIKTDTIDDNGLLEVFHKICGCRKVIYNSVVVFFTLGLIIALVSPEEYKPEVVLLVETSSSNSGMSGLLKSFGGLIGLGNLGSRMNEHSLTPELYPIIIKSTPFLKLMEPAKRCNSLRINLRQPYTCDNNSLLD